MYIILYITDCCRRQLFMMICSQAEESTRFTVESDGVYLLVNPST